MAVRWKAVSVLGTVAALAALAGFLPSLAEQAALAGLKAVGMPGSRLTVAEVGWSHAVVQDLRLGETGPAVARIEARFDLADLLARGHVEALSVSGLDAALRRTPEGIEVSGLPLPGSSGGGGLTLGNLVVDATTLRLLDDPAPLPPLTLTGQAKSGADGGWTFQARARALDGKLVLDVAGHHGAEGGQADLRLYPVRFAPGGLQPREVSPAYATGLPDLGALVDADGPIYWNNKGLSGNVKITTKEGAITVGGLKVEDVEGKLVLASLKDIRLIDLRARTAGGTIALPDFPLVAPKAGPRKGLLTVDGVDAQALLEAFKVPDIAVKGRLQGTVPFTLDGDRLAIAAGRLEAAGPGFVRYMPGTPPDALQAGGQGASLMLSALRNFHFKELRLTADREAEGRWQARIRLAGANPELMNGRPFEFNINIDGALDTILRQGLEGWRLPQTLADALVHRERK